MRAALVDLYDEECAACHQPMDRFALHVDHIVPLSEGGNSEIANLMLLCPACDGMKKALSLVGLLAGLERQRREAQRGGQVIGQTRTGRVCRDSCVTTADESAAIRP